MTSPSDAGSTANHAQELGFRTVFLEDCSRGIDPSDIKDTLDRVRASHGVVVNSNEACWIPIFLPGTNVMILTKIFRRK
jgi:hypothetical protein